MECEITDTKQKIKLMHCMAKCDKPTLSSSMSPLRTRSTTLTSSRASKPYQYAHERCGLIVDMGHAWTSRFCSVTLYSAGFLEKAFRRSRASPKMVCRSVQADLWLMCIILALRWTSWARSTSRRASFSLLEYWLHRCDQTTSINAGALLGWT